MKNGYEVIPQIERAIRELYYYSNKADGLTIDNIKWGNNLSTVVGADNENVYFICSDGLITFDIFNKTIKYHDRNNTSTINLHEYNPPQNAYAEYADDSTFIVRRIDNNELMIKQRSKTPIKLLPNYIVSELDDEINIVPYSSHKDAKNWRPNLSNLSWDASKDIVVAFNDSIVSFYNIESAKEDSYKLHHSEGFGFSLPGRLDKDTSKFIHITTDSIIQIFEPEGLLLETQLNNQIKGVILGGNDFSKIFLIYRDNSSELFGYSHETPKLVSLYKSEPLFDYGYSVMGSFINDKSFYVTSTRSDIQIYTIPDLSNLEGKHHGFLSKSGKSNAQFMNENWYSIDIEAKEGVRLGGESLYDFVAYSGNDSIIIFREELPYRSEMGNDITQIRYVNIPTRENVELSGTTMEEHMQKVAVSKNGNLIVCNRINDSNNFITLLNTKSKTVSSTSIETSPSTLFYDNSDKYIYVICGNDLLHIKIEDDKIGKIKTADISNHGYIIGGICNPLNDEEVIVWTYEGEVQFWDRATKVTKRIQPWKQNCLIFDMSISQDGKYLLVTYYHDGVGLSNYNLDYREKELVIYDVKSGEVIFNVPTNYMLNSFSNDGGRIISNHRQGTHWIIDFPATDNLVKWILSEK